MVNRDINFNRKYSKRLQVIRKNKRSKAALNTRKRDLTRPEENTTPVLSKKMQKRQDRLKTIYNNLNIKVSDIFSRKRKNQMNRKNQPKKPLEKMDIE